MRRYLIGLACLAVLVVAVLGGLAAWLSLADQRALAERFARSITGRDVTVAGLRLTLGREIAFELTGLRLPNASWSQHPEMMTVARATGTVDAWSLLATPKLAQLRIEGYRIRLERGPERIGNWRFDGKTPAETKDEPDPPVRGNFPYLLNATIADGDVVYRTTSGSELKIDVRSLALRAEDLDSPLQLVVDGAYNDKPVALTGKLGTYRELHDVAKPFPTALSGKVEAGTLRLDGTMMRPIDFDGIDSKLHIDISDLGKFIGMFGKPVGLPITLKADTTFTRSAQNWRLADLAGALAGMTVTGDFKIEEAAGGGADSFDVQLAFDRLDVDKLQPRQPGSNAPTTIGPDKDAGRLAAAITAKRVDFAGRHFTDASLKLTQEPDRMALDELRFTLWRGQFQIAARSVSGPRVPEFRLDLTASGVDAAALSREFGATGEVTGRLDAAASLTGFGDKLADLRDTASGQAVIVMGNGRIASSLLEMASADLRALFRSKEGMTPITCFATVARVQRGVATVQPLRLRTAEATFLGSGRVTLSGQLDLWLGSDPDTTGSLALDIPVHITGSFDDPHIRPGRGRASTGGVAGTIGGNPGALIARNACAR